MTHPIDHDAARKLAEKILSEHDLMPHWNQDAALPTLARAYLDRDSRGWRPTREQIAKALMDPQGKYPLEAMMARDNWDNCLRSADAILALTPPPPQVPLHG